MNKPINRISAIRLFAPIKSMRAGHYTRNARLSGPLSFPNRCIGTSYLLKVAAAFLILCGVAGSQVAPQNPESVKAERIPPRAADAMTGSDFARRTAGMSGEDRQKAALIELSSGNIPDFLRNLKPIRLVHVPERGKPINGEVWVTPDYLAVGSDDDFLRIPLTLPSAIQIANEFGFTLPTRKIVDAVFKQSTCLLEPDPMPPGPKMRSSEYYLRHQQMIHAARLRVGCALGELTSGPKKDIVLTNRLLEKTGRIAIYGWYRSSGDKIQPLSTVHGARYADYSHGIRLVSQTIVVNGEKRDIYDVLENPDLSPLLTYEGFFVKLTRLLGLRKVRE